MFGYAFNRGEECYLFGKGNLFLIFFKVFLINFLKDERREVIKMIFFKLMEQITIEVFIENV